MKSASIFVGNVTSDSERIRAQCASSGIKMENRQWHVLKVLIDAANDIEDREIARISVVNVEKTARRKFPLTDKKITILPNRQLFMLSPLRTIGIFSLPTVILSRS